MRSILMMFVLVLVVSACGDGDEAADTSTTTTEAPTTTEAASGNVVVTLSEFVIDTEDTLTAGEVTFDVVNDAGSEFNHEFAIIAADSYDELPKLDNGAVDEQALAEGQFLGRTAVLEPGQSETITFDLEPGTYLFICNINFGPNSHAANGQMLIATVNP